MKLESDLFRTSYKAYFKVLLMRCVRLIVCAPCVVLKGSKKGIRSHRTGVLDNFEPYDMGARN